MPSSFIDLERGNGLCCRCRFPPSVPSACRRRLGRGCVSSKGRARRAAPGTAAGLARLPVWHRPCRRPGGAGGHDSPGRRERSRPAGPPNSPDLCKGKITNIFHFKLQLNVEVLWLQGASFPTLSWSDFQVPPLSSLVKT